MEKFKPRTHTFIVQMCIQIVSERRLGVEFINVLTLILGKFEGLLYLGHGLRSTSCHLQQGPRDLSFVLLKTTSLKFNNQESS
jgi:hypothetical protein